MKIFSVNLTEQLLEKIADLVGDDKLYCSRSELIRVALRDFFKEQIELAKEVKEKMIETVTEKIDNEEYIKVPYKTYKIIREA